MAVFVSALLHPCQPSHGAQGMDCHGGPQWIAPSFEGTEGFGECQENFVGACRGCPDHRIQGVRCGPRSEWPSSMPSEPRRLRPWRKEKTRCNVSRQKRRASFRMWHPPRCQAFLPIWQPRWSSCETWHVQNLELQGSSKRQAVGVLTPFCRSGPTFAGGLSPDVQRRDHEVDGRSANRHPRGHHGRQRSRRGKVLPCHGLRGHRRVNTEHVAVDGDHSTLKPRESEATHPEWGMGLFRVGTIHHQCGFLGCRVGEGQKPGLRTGDPSSKVHFFFRRCSWGRHQRKGNRGKQ